MSEIRNNSIKKNNKPKTRKLSNKGIIIISVAALLILCIIISLLIFYDIMHNSIYETPDATSSQNIEIITLPPLETESEQPTQTAEPTEDVKYKPVDDIEYILLFGLAEYNLADTIWIAVINKTDNTVNILSIPRDTYLRYSDRNNPEHWKINSYYNNYKDDIWIKTDDSTSSMNLLGACEKLLNIDMDHYVRVSYDTIERIVDAMGGIEYDVPFDMHYYDYTEGHELFIEIDEGYQVLDGENVVKFLRFRQGDGYEYISDIARIERQHKMINAILKKALTLSNISSVIDVAKNNIRTNISKDKLTSLITFSLSLNTDKISYYTLKGEEKMVDTGLIDDEGKPNIKSFYITKPEDIKQQIISISE